MVGLCMALLVVMVEVLGICLFTALVIELYHFSIHLSNCAGEAWSGGSALLMEPSMVLVKPSQSA